MHLQDASGQFQVQLRADGRSEHTRRQYERHVRALIGWLAGTDYGTEMESLTPGVVAAFLASDAATTCAHGGTKKASSANAMRTSIRCFFRWAHESGLVAANPARLLRRARCSPPPPKALHPDEQATLLKVLDAAQGQAAERDRALIYLLLYSGIRIGSAVALDIEDIDLERGELTLRSTKNDAPAVAVLPASAAAQLRQLIGEQSTGPVFVAGDKRVSLRNVQRRIAQWLAAAGIKGRSAHSLRHSFATALLGRTGDLRLVQAAMGHRSIVSTTIYAAMDKGRLRAAVGG